MLGLCNIPDVQQQKSDKEGRDEESVDEVLGSVARRPKNTFLIFH